MTTTTALILDSSRDWEDWNEEFYAEAETRDLVEVVFEGEEALTKPKMRSEEYYATLFPAKTALVAPQSTTVTRGRGGASRGNSSTRSQTARAASQNPQDRETIAVQEEDGNESDESDDTPPGRLTARAKSEYRFDFSIFKENKAAYELQSRGIQVLTSYLNKTVALQYRQTCFRGMKTLSEKYTALKLAAKPTPMEEKAFALQKYEEAVRPPKKMSIKLWVEQWEGAIRVGQARGVPHAGDSAIWLRDLIQTLGGVNERWADKIQNVFQLNNEKEADFRAVSRALKLMIESDPTKPAGRRRGTFGPTFKG
jgi:hypothetical protein